MFSQLLPPLFRGNSKDEWPHDVITCPECRRESQVPGGNLKDLPTNFRINSLLDVLAIRECSSTGVKCGNCETVFSAVHSGVTSVSLCTTYSEQIKNTEFSR